MIKVKIHHCDHKENYFDDDVDDGKDNSRL